MKFNLFLNVVVYGLFLHLVERNIYQRDWDGAIIDFLFGMFLAIRIQEQIGREEWQ